MNCALGRSRGMVRKKINVILVASATADCMFLLGKVSAVILASVGRLRQAQVILYMCISRNADYNSCK